MFFLSIEILCTLQNLAYMSILLPCQSKLTSSSVLLRTLKAGSHFSTSIYARCVCLYLCISSNELFEHRRYSLSTFVNLSAHSIALHALYTKE